MRRQIEVPVWLVILWLGLLLLDVVTETHGWENWLALLVIAIVCGIGYNFRRRRARP